MNEFTIDDEKLKAAAVMLVVSPLGGGTGFGKVEALTAAGFSVTQANKKNLCDRLSIAVDVVRTKIGVYDARKESDRTMSAKAVDIAILSKNSTTGKKRNLAECLRLAGFKDTGPGKSYKKVQRWLESSERIIEENPGTTLCLSPYLLKVFPFARCHTYGGASLGDTDEEALRLGLEQLSLEESGCAFQETKAAESEEGIVAIAGKTYKLVEVSPADQQKPPPAVIDLTHRNVTNNSLLSPMSKDSSMASANGIDLSATNVAAGADQVQVFREDPTCARSSDPSSVRSLASLVAKAGKAPGTVSIAQLIGAKQKRKSSKAAQQERRDHETLQRIRSSAYKVGTTLLSTVKNGKNELIHLKTADLCAYETNKMFGLELVSGRQLSKAYNSGRVGMSPPRQGRPSEVSDEVFEAVCSLVFTAESIDQANCSENRLQRNEMTSTVGVIANEVLAKTSEACAQLTDDHAFLRRVERRNSTRQDVAVVESRDSRRMAFLTYHAQMSNHQRFEDTCCKLEFARQPVSEAERSEHGFVVFHERSFPRILQFDEMNMSLDCIEEIRGGRPASSHTNPDLPDGGKPKGKSGKTCTIMMGCNFAFEALPPYFMFPSDAQEPTVNSELMLAFPQVRGQYGWESPRAFNVPFTKNKKGGMNAKAFYHWFRDCIKLLYPDAADQPGKRILDKSDSGPGRDNNMFLFEARVDGFYHFPSTPNGTEVCQEMDRLFGFFKDLIMDNKNKLLMAKWQLEGSKNGSLSYVHGVACVFGTPVTLKHDGGASGVISVTVELVDAFSIAMSSEKIREAVMKCGYVPATRKSLESSLIRHEAIVDDAGNPNLEQDPLSELLLSLEKDNEEACQFLIDNGAQSASLLRRKVNRITSEQFRGRESVRTQPCTRERQDQLMKVRTAGQFFHVTRGGDALNGDDMLLARARKSMVAKAASVEKIKVALEEFTVIEAEGKAIVAQCGLDGNLSMPQLRKVIRWMQGPNQPPNEKLSKFKKRELETLWAKYKEKGAPVGPVWCERYEGYLTMLRNGDIRSIEESNEFKDAVNRNADYLSTRLLSLSSKRRLAVMDKALDKMELGEQDDFLSKLIVSRFDCAGQNGQRKLQDVLGRLNTTSQDDDDSNYDDVEAELSVIASSTDPLRLLFESSQQDGMDDSGDDGGDVSGEDEDNDDERALAGTSIGRLTALLKRNAGDDDSDDEGDGNEGDEGDGDEGDGDEGDEEGGLAAFGGSDWLTELKRKLSSDSSNTDHSETSGGMIGNGTQNSRNRAQQSDDDDSSSGYEGEQPSPGGDFRRSTRQRKLPEKLRKSHVI